MINQKQCQGEKASCNSQNDICNTQMIVCEAEKTACETEESTYDNQRVRCTADKEALKIRNKQLEKSLDTCNTALRAATKPPPPPPTCMCSQYPILYLSIFCPPSKYLWRISVTELLIQAQVRRMDRLDVCRVRISNSTATTVSSYSSFSLPYDI